MQRRMKVLIPVWLFCLWLFHVVSLNRAYQTDETFYNMQEPFSWQGLEVTLQEAHLYTVEEYERNFGTSLSSYNMSEWEKESRILCIKVKAVNYTGEEISWDTFFDFFGYGFESVAWYSAAVPYLTRDINVVHSDTFEADAAQEFWLAAVVSSECFSEKSWNNIEQMPFYYVLDVLPHRKLIRIQVQNSI